LPQPSRFSIFLKSKLNISCGNFIILSFQKFSTIFLPKPSILKASLETKCFNFSITIFSHSYPSLEHLLTASSFFVTLLNSLIVLEPHEGHFFGKINFNKIKSLEGWGRQSVENLKYSINQRKNISLERLIYSLGIRHIGLENAKILSKYFKSFSNFINFSNEVNSNDILNIDGIGETQLQSIKNFFDNKVNLNILKELQKNLKVKDSIIKDKNGLLNEKTFMITGKLNGISRAEVKSLIEENSGSSVSTVSKKLNYLIIGDKPTKKKVDKALELKITILNQSQFLKI